MRMTSMGRANRCKCTYGQRLGDGCDECNPRPKSAWFAEKAEDWMADYFPGWYCSSYRCVHYRMAEEGSPAWCWLRHGIGAEGMQPHCPAYKRELRLVLKRPNKLDHRLDASDACGQSGGSKGSA